MIRLQPYQSSGLAGVIRWYDTVGSTNDVLKALAESGGDEGTVVIADVQTAGRGRQGRRWISERGSGLFLSVLLRPQIPVKKLGHVTLVSAIVAVEAIAHFLNADGTDPRGRVDIKWPNDVWIDEKKIAGILVETGLVVERVKWAVVGIGVNLTSGSLPSELTGQAIAMSDVTSAPVNRDAFAMDLLQRFGVWYGKAAESRFDEIRNRWCELSSFAAGRLIEIETGEGTLRGTTRGLDPDGGLLVRLDSGEERAVFVGEVLRVVPSPRNQPE